MRNIGKIYKLFLLLVLFSGNLSAQTVTIDGNNHPVIDLSALQPLGAVLSLADASDRRTEMNKETPSNTTYLSVGAAVSGQNGTWNAQMSGKFQVMCADHTVGYTDWATAYNRCKSYNGEGSSTAGEWRLPTQRELAQIMILHPQLIGKGDFKVLTANVNYWSLTEFFGNAAWYLRTTSGQMFHSNSKKDEGYSVRCVRDVE